MITTEITPRPFVTLAQIGRTAIPLDAPQSQGGGQGRIDSRCEVDAPVQVD